MMTRLVPKVFFDRISEGLDLFVNDLGFEVCRRRLSHSACLCENLSVLCVKNTLYEVRTGRI